MFSSERELVETLKTSYRKLCDWDGAKYTTKLVEEVNVGYGVADIVISKIKGTQVTTTPLNYFDITVYKIIEQGDCITFDTIQKITRTNKRDIENSLERLLFESYIKESDSLFQIQHTYQSIVSKSVAIEAKLKNWRRALAQAQRYKWFAHQSYVVLDSKFINGAVKNLDEFKTTNVGLAELSKTDGLFIHYTPKSATPVNEKMQMLFDEYMKLTLISA